MVYLKLEQTEPLVSNILISVLHLFPIQSQSLLWVRVKLLWGSFVPIYLIFVNYKNTLICMFL